MDLEAKIISKHNLDLSSIENLASDIAARLNCNVEFREYSKSDKGHIFSPLGKIIRNESDIFSTLFNLQTDKLSNYDYVLELGEEAKLIYKKMISFFPPREVLYDEVLTNFNEGALATDSYYAGFLKSLKF